MFNSYQTIYDQIMHNIISFYCGKNENVRKKSVKLRLRCLLFILFFILVEVNNISLSFANM